MIQNYISIFSKNSNIISPSNFAIKDCKKNIQKHIKKRKIVGGKIRKNDQHLENSRKYIKMYGDLNYFVNFCSSSIWNTWRWLCKEIGRKLTNKKMYKNIETLKIIKKCYISMPGA